MKTCSISLCGKAHYAKGMCQVHYERQRRNGDPHTIKKTMVAKGEPLLWLKQHVSHSGEECLIWPYARLPSGYGHMRWNGRTHKASRVMCILAHGQPHIPELVAAHSCGKGTEGCVNPRHLRWATGKQNCADTAIHGKASRGINHYAARLTEQAVTEIRSSFKPVAEIASAYGVSKSTIYGVRSGRKWSWMNAKD